MLVIAVAAAVVAAVVAVATHVAWVLEVDLCRAMRWKVRHRGRGSLSEVPDGKEKMSYAAGT